MSAGDLRGERDRPDTDRVAVLEPVVDARGRVAADPDPEIGRHALDEFTLATPAISNGCLFIRTATKLYRIDRGRATETASVD